MLEPGRIGITYFSFQTVSDDGIAAIEQIAIDLTTDGKHVDLDFFVSAVLRACSVVTTMT